MQQPELKKRISISPIWFLPFLALCLGLWLLYDSYQESGKVIRITFSDAEGVVAGKTRVMLRGIPIGVVERVDIDKDLEKVILQVEIKREAEGVLREDSKFWIVRPEVSAGRITGLGTLISGHYIAVKVGSSEKMSKNFVGLEHPPPVDIELPGLHIVLQAEKLYSLQVGSNIYFKNIKIGTVEGYELQEDKTVAINVFIKPEFAHLINKKTVFWNSSGISLTGDLQSGFRLNVESLASLVYGGISCANSDDSAEGEAVEAGYSFQLYEDFMAAKQGLPMQLALKSAKGIVAGKTRIMYQGIGLGVVKEVTFNNDGLFPVLAEVVLDPQGEFLLRKGSRFWLIKAEASLAGFKNLDTLLSGSYIEAVPGDGDEYSNNFTIEDGNPPSSLLRAGRKITLSAEDSTSLSVGNPVLFKGVQVGEVASLSLAEDGSEVLCTVVIHEPYKKLVQDNSVFWKVDGIKVEADISGISMEMSSLETVVTGGIEFVNPGKQAEVAKEEAIGDKSFHLYSSYKEAVKAEKEMQPDGLVLRLETSDPLKVKVGSGVFYNRVKVGEVMDISISRKNRNVNLELLIWDEFRHLLNESSRFFQLTAVSIEGGLQGITMETAPMEAAFKGGIGFVTPKKDARESKRNKNKIFQLYKNKTAAELADKVRLKLYMDEAGGLKKKSSLKHLGAIIGEITEIEYKTDSKKVVAMAVVDKEFAPLFTEDTIIYLVRPQIDLTGIYNIDAVLGGSYLSIIPGSGKRSNSFVVRERIPVMAHLPSGLNIILESKTRGSLTVGSPIYYRQVQIGKITGVSLSPTSQQVWLNGNIYEQYRYLVYSSSKFWNSSGIEVSGGLFSGLEVNTESVDSLVRGGVSMATPEGVTKKERAKDGDHFVLAEKADPAWKEWSPKLMMPEWVKKGLYPWVFVPDDLISSGDEDEIPLKKVQ